MGKYGTEVTARVQKAFLSFFSICLIYFDFSDLFTDLARACLGFLRSPSRSCEVVRVRHRDMIRYGSHNRTAASLDVRGPGGPDLTWQRTLAVVVCAALAGVFKIST
jgi:hypothetical protein